VRQSSTSAQWKSQTPMAADAACGSWKCTASAGRLSLSSGLVAQFVHQAPTMSVLSQQAWTKNIQDQ